MRRARAFATLSLGCTAALVAAGVGPASAGGSHGGGGGGSSARVVLDDLSSPKGLALDPDGNPVVGQGAFGPPGPIVQVLQGRRGVRTVDITDPINTIDVAVSRDGQHGWALVQGPDGPDGPSGPEGTQDPDGILYHRSPDGTISVGLNINTWRLPESEGGANVPDPSDQDDNPYESNPYGLAVLPNGDALVADAAGNMVIRVTPEGAAEVVAYFGTEEVAPGATAEAVPTSIAVGRDGAIYVGELKGFPFVPGSSHVWRFRIDRDGKPAECTVGQLHDCRVAADGLTAIQDIALGRDGSLYVYELAADGVLAFEEALGSGGPVPFPPAVLLKVKNGHQRELAAGELSQPGGVAVSRSGRVYVTDNIFTPGGGRLLRIT